MPIHKTMMIIDAAPCNFHHKRARRWNLFLLRRQAWVSLNNEKCERGDGNRCESFIKMIKICSNYTPWVDQRQRRLRVFHVNMQGLVNSKYLRNEFRKHFHGNCLRKRLRMSIIGNFTFTTNSTSLQNLILNFGKSEVKTFAKLEIENN